MSSMPFRWFLDKLSIYLYKFVTVTVQSSALGQESQTSTVVSNPHGQLLAEHLLRCTPFGVRPAFLGWALLPRAPSPVLLCAHVRIIPTFSGGNGHCLSRCQAVGVVRAFQSPWTCLWSAFLYASPTSDRQALLRQPFPDKPEGADFPVL